MKILYKNINDLIPYINNPRINDNAINAVASSIKNFGFKVPIIIDVDNEIVAGHTRLKAAKKLKLDKVPCIVADDLTEAQIKAFRLADNKVAELSTWDLELLDNELEELDLIEELDFDINDFGFIEISDLDTLDDFFYETEEGKEDKKKIIVCPFCNKEFHDD